MQMFGVLMEKSYVKIAGFPLVIPKTDPENFDEVVGISLRHHKPVSASRDMFPERKALSSLS